MGRVKENGKRKRKAKRDDWKGERKWEEKTENGKS